MNEKTSSKENLSSLEFKIAQLLRIGVLIAGGLLLIGWISFLDFTQNPLLQFQEYKNEPLLQSLQEALLTQQWGLLLAYVGLGVLISLPLIRVFMTGILLSRQKERLLAFLAFSVFISLIISFSLGIEL